MKKRISILGSTGSIGENTLKILRRDKKDFEINLLTTNKNISKVFKQAKVFLGLLQTIFFFYLF